MTTGTNIYIFPLWLLAVMLGTLTLGSNAVAQESNTKESLRSNPGTIDTLKTPYINIGKVQENEQ
jgi:hypothetical protein